MACGVKLLSQLPGEYTTWLVGIFTYMNVSPLQYIYPISGLKSAQLPGEYAIVSFTYMNISFNLEHEISVRR